MSDEESHRAFAAPGGGSSNGGRGGALGETDTHRKKTFRPEHVYLRVRVEFARPVASFSAVIFKTVLNNCVSALAGTVGNALHGIDVLSYDEEGDTMVAGGYGGRNAVLRVERRSSELVQAALAMCARHEGVACRISVVGGPSPFLMALASPRFF